MVLVTTRSSTPSLAPLHPQELKERGPLTAAEIHERFGPGAGREKDGEEEEEEEGEEEEKEEGEEEGGEEEKEEGEEEEKEEREEDCSGTEVEDEEGDA